MKMDRNINADGSGKYVVVNMRKLRALRDTNEQMRPDIIEALRVLSNAGALEWGSVGAEDEFFLVKLKDRHSLLAIQAYADSIRMSDPEFADEVYEMTMRAGPHSKFCKDPD
jgi:hypothetical protein